MHVENNLTANLLHSFSFLFRTFRPASARRTYRTLPFVPSPTRRERALLSVRRARAAHLAPFSALRAACARARHRSHLIEYIIWIFELYHEKGRRRETGKRRGGRVRGGRSAGTRGTDAPRDKFMNFMGIWRSCRARDYGAPISWSVPYGSSLDPWIRFLHSTWNNPADVQVIIYAGDIIKGLDRIEAWICGRRWIEDRSKSNFAPEN